MDPKSGVRSALTVTLVALVAGCAAIPRAPQERDAAVKTFTPTPGKANLYVFRDEAAGAPKPLTVRLDGKLLGNTQGKTFLFAQVDPGQHRLVSEGENDAALAFTAEDGKNVFVWQEVKRGLLRARSSLALVDEARGREGVAACALVLPVSLE